MAEGCAVDCFKEEFKRYKKRGADLSNVIDFSSLPSTHSPEVELVPVSQLPDSKSSYSEQARCLGLKPPENWLLYKVVAVPGLLVVPNPFATGGQHGWVRRCLVDYPCRPNACNLDAHSERSGDGRLWPSHTTASGDGLATQSGVPGEGGGQKAHANKRLKLSKDDLLHRLRWVTLGYHYDWTNKVYSSQNRSPFPTDLAELSSFLLAVIGFPRFCAEAAIINYYHLDSTLSGHTDHSEMDLSRPLLSLSFGQSAIFLIGGKTKQTRPKALLLQSGDVVVMSAESRLAYHGVPRILPPSSDNPVPHELSLHALRQPIREQDASDSTEVVCHCCMCGRDKTDQSAVVPHRGDGTTRGCPSCQELAASWQEFMDYLSVSRINVNARQVVSEKHGFEDT